MNPNTVDGSDEFDCFTGADEFVDVFSRGCEAEFLYKGKHYCITPFAGKKGNKMSISEAYNEKSEKLYDNPVAALKHLIEGEELGDILGKMKVIDRTL